MKTASCHGITDGREARTAQVTGGHGPLPALSYLLPPSARVKKHSRFPGVPLSRLRLHLTARAPRARSPQVTIPTFPDESGDTCSRESLATQTRKWLHAT